MITSLVLTPLAARLFKRIGWTQMIRIDGPSTHLMKKGTPTKGGIVFTFCALVGYFTGTLASGDGPTRDSLLAILLMLTVSLVGFLDDLTKTRRERSLGLTEWQKIAGQLLAAAIFAVWGTKTFSSDRDQPVSMGISFVHDISWLSFAKLWAPLGIVLTLGWIVLLVVSTSNAVNVTDGADGLAAGASIFTIAAYAFISYLQAPACTNSAGCGGTTHAPDLTVLCIAVIGSLAGYLWWSCPPAGIFMGDTGSMALGGLIVALAILTKTELLLIVIGALYCMVAGSVVVQRAYFKFTGGRRIFLMAPIHHHFELKGWPEVQITIRFWIISGIAMAVGCAIYYFA